MLDKIEVALNDGVVKSLSQGGGCIADSRIVETKSGNKYFLKQGFANGMFGCEANGLIEIAKSNTIRTPKVIVVDRDFLLLEFVSQSEKTEESMFNFGCQLAEMHKCYSSSFGFFEDNFIGANRQKNSVSQNWVDFYFENRLLFQYQLAERNGYVTSEFKAKFLKLEQRLHTLLKGSEEHPSLLHGDLWGGNYLIDEHGQAVLIDPAVYYGHREADLAMTKLFGGFSAEFYEGYKATFPLLKGYEFRENLYLLYHVINHLNLFGSGFYLRAINLIEYYLK